MDRARLSVHLTTSGFEVVLCLIWSYRGRSRPPVFARTL